MRVLFICNQNLHRSRTAEDVFRGLFETKSAGLFNEKPVTEEQVAWADLVFVTEDFQRKEIAKRFPKQYMKKRIVSFNIPDAYQYGDEKLITLLKKGVRASL